MTTVKELIEQLERHDPDLRVATWRVEDYGDSGALEFLGMSIQEVWEGEDPDDSEEPSSVLVISSNQPPDDALISREGEIISLRYEVSALRDAVAALRDFVDGKRHDTHNIPKILNKAIDNIKW